MTTLTINIRICNQEHYEGKVAEIQEELAGISGVQLQIKKDTGAFYSTYKEFMATTTGQYVLFYRDEEEVEGVEIQALVSYLKETRERFFMQNLAEPIKNAHLYFEKYIFKTSLLKTIELSDVPVRMWQEKILLDFAYHCGRAITIEKSTLYTSAIMENNHNSYEPQFHKSWYQEDLEDFYLPYIQKFERVPKEVQRRVYYALLLRFYMNLDGRDKFVIQGEEIERFFACARNILRYIDDDVILNRGAFREMPSCFPYLCLKEKHNDNLQMSVEPDEKMDMYWINGEKLGSNFISVYVWTCNYEDGELHFNCELRGDYFIANPKEDFHVFANKEELDVTEIKTYNLQKVFGVSMYRFYQFHFSISKERLENGLSISFTAYTRDGQKMRVPLKFSDTASRLTPEPWAYYTFGDYMMTCTHRKFIIKKKSNKRVLFRECKALADIRGAELEKDEKRQILSNRIRYWLTKPKYARKQVWIFFDKLYKAGDNAEYLFSYCHEHAEADCYYIVNSASADYPRLKQKYGKHILEFQSARQLAVVMHADIIFATHADVWGFCGFKKSVRRYLRNFLNAKVVCIQHGLTVQDIAQYQNKLYDNTALYCCASKYEIDNLKRPVYGYEGKELLLTGSPRYDGLINNDKKQILITPTWRRNIVITGNQMGTAKDYNPQFKDTEYFKIYNRLVNDERLLEAAKQYGYTILYLLHPTLSSQIADFDTNAYLKIVPATSDISYEQVLTESSLMLTDYSGVQFDFAYMKKPVLYYHPEELPPQYEETVYKYESMGFGPIVKQYDMLIDELCRSMAGGCKMEEKYVDRVEDFFAYTDHNNCQRILDIVKEWEA